MSKRKFHRKVMQWEILSQEKIPDGTGIEVMARECDIGEWSGRLRTLLDVTITGAQAVRRLADHGSDPSFFELDAHGNCTGDDLPANTAERTAREIGWVTAQELYDGRDKIGALLTAMRVIAPDAVDEIVYNLDGNPGLKFFSESEQDFDSAKDWEELCSRRGYTVYEPGWAIPEEFSDDARGLCLTIRNFMTHVVGRDDLHGDLAFTSDIHTDDVVINHGIGSDLRVVMGDQSVGTAWGERMNTLLRQNGWKKTAYTYNLTLLRPNDNGSD